jgi:hypothetical protein
MGGWCLQLGTALPEAGEWWRNEAIAYHQATVGLISLGCARSVYTRKGREVSVSSGSSHFLDHAVPFQWRMSEWSISFLLQFRTQ